MPWSQAEPGDCGSGTAGGFQKERTWLSEIRGHDPALPPLAASLTRTEGAHQHHPAGRHHLPRGGQATSLCPSGWSVPPGSGAADARGRHGLPYQAHPGLPPSSRRAGGSAASLRARPLEHRRLCEGAWPGRPPQGIHLIVCWLSVGLPACRCPLPAAQGRPASAAMARGAGHRHGPCPVSE